MLKKKKEARDHSALPSLSLLITRKPPKSRSREPSAFLPSFQHQPTPTPEPTRQSHSAHTLVSFLIAKFLSSSRVQVSCLTPQTEASSP
ncbi:hypothetical protein CABS01_04187 [Colletotrichum abscissum]|uniref:uncharacterized protein n=1 Tax=Colletotrichum abscissum TaxID=1671311 RepID=UPI0027D5C329|nr:uncharacterized protein CABS01_04187 [Colletotrichum abscissum]KAK1473525.1 hypothetical protein CABS01_04187 [Colletotrichum abscissum]